MMQITDDAGRVGVMGSHNEIGGLNFYRRVCYSVGAVLTLRTKDSATLLLPATRVRISRQHAWIERIDLDTNSGLEE
jgi:hypothetical protein